MNTMKKILMLVLALSLLVGVTLSFASCELEGLIPGTGEGTAPGTDDGTEPGTDDEPQVPDGYHCPTDCTCREGLVDPDHYHCPDDCVCKLEQPAPTPTDVTYIVIVRDTQGGLVEGAKVVMSNGTTTIEKTTDATGTLTFNLAQGTWNAFVTSAPAGYDYDPATKYEFTTDGICAIELGKPVGYTFSLKSAYGEQLAVEGVLVSLYAYDEELGLYDTEAAVAEDLTNAEGLVTLEVVPGKYLAQFFVEGDSYVDEVYIDVVDNIYDVEVLDREGTINNPIYATYGSELWIENVANGSEKWVYVSGGKTLVINDADAYVKIGDDTYAPDENGIITVELEGTNWDEILIAVGYSSDAEDAEESKIVTGTFVYPEGTRDNPIILDDIADLTKVTLEADPDGNEIWYTWTPNYSGRLFLLCDHANNYVVLECGSKASESGQGLPFTSVDFIAGLDVDICVSAVEGWDYVAAELEFEAVVYAKYAIKVTDIEDAAAPNEKVTVTDADGNVVAIAYTDFTGKAEVALPAGQYNVKATAPDGYTTNVASLGADATEVTLTPARWNLNEFANEDGTAYEFELDAKQCYHIEGRVGGVQIFTLTGAEELKVVYNENTYTADENGNISIVMVSGGFGQLANIDIYNNGTNYVVANATFVPYPGVSPESPIKLELGNTYTAEIGEYASMGCIFYSFKATEDGTLKITTASNLASVTINNYTTGVYGEAQDAPAETSVEAPFVVEYDVAIGDELEIIMGVNDWVDANIEFTVNLVPAVHECNFKDNVSELYFAAAPTTKNGTLYYKSCACGLASEETFEVGDPIPSDDLSSGALPSYINATPATAIPETGAYNAILDENGNKYWSIGKVDGGSENAIKWNFDVQGIKVNSFWFDFRWNGGTKGSTDNWAGYLKFYDTTGAQNGSGNLESAESNTALKFLGTNFEIGQWMTVNMVFEYTEDGKTNIIATVYDADMKVAGTQSWTRTGVINGIVIHPRGSWTAISYDFDNFALVTEHNCVGSEVVNNYYLKVAATPTSKGIYYKSCSYCGKVFDQTFEYGNFEQFVVGEVPTLSDLSSAPGGVAEAPATDANGDGIGDGRYLIVKTETITNVKGEEISVAYVSYIDNNDGGCKQFRINKTDDTAAHKNATFAFNFRFQGAGAWRGGAWSDDASQVLYYNDIGTADFSDNKLGSFKASEDGQTLTMNGVKMNVGEWHHVEYVYTWNETNANYDIKVVIDGQTALTTTGTAIAFSWEPRWGGGDPVGTSDVYFDLDEVIYTAE